MVEEGRRGTEKDTTEEEEEGEGVGGGRLLLSLLLVSVKGKGKVDGGGGEEIVEFWMQVVCLERRETALGVVMATDQREVGQNNKGFPGNHA